MKIINSRYILSVVFQMLSKTTPRPAKEGVGAGILLCLLLFTSCAIKDDLPLPVQKAAITVFEVEGQCDATGEGYAVAQIDKDKSTVDLYVDDRVDITRLRIKQMTVSFDAHIALENTKASFPETSFSYSGASCPTLDCSNELTFVLTTYQTYRWKVRVHQVIKREVEVDNQVGTAVINPADNTVVVYVAPNQDLSRVKVNKMMLSGIHGQISPDPTGQIVDFNLHRTYQVTYAWTDVPETWDVYVWNADKSLATTATVFPHASKAYVSGEMQNGTTPVVVYRMQGSNEWITVPSSQMTVNTTSYEAEITSLIPGTGYECQVTANGTSSGLCLFRTAPELQLENAGLDDWHTDGSGNQILYNPWKEGGSRYWDTGNRGATTVGPSNSTYVTQGGRTYANLQSKYILIKFAAGNIFTGQYLSTDGTDGILSFGRPFDSFPTKLQFDYTYKASLANKGGNKWDDKYSRYISVESYNRMSSHTVPDSCSVYVALIGDKDEEAWDDTNVKTGKMIGDGKTYPFIIRTKIFNSDTNKRLKLFDPNDENVIAYGQFTSGDDQTDWTTKTITLDYRYKNRTPKYIIVVASSSKYGDYFMGSDASLLTIDNFKLLYN